MEQDVARRIALQAYLEGLPRVERLDGDRDALREFLGDIDRQAGSMEMTERMALAGRVFAASVVASGGAHPEQEEVENLIDALLSYGRPQREEAAPLGDGRLWPEDEAASGLGELIEEADDDDLAEEFATVASYLLQFGLRPSMDVDAALEVGEDVRHLAREGQAILDVAGSFGLAAATPGTLLDRAAERSRELLERRLRGGRGNGVDLAHGATAREAWIHLAAALVAVRARWEGTEPAWDAVVARATERIASSLVHGDPTRFAAEACADHATGVVVAAATTWLDEALLDGDAPSMVGDVESREFVWESLMEAASSGLVGAWVESRGT